MRGEYVLRLTNISEDANEQIGVWTSPTAPENVRNYRGGIEVANAARMNAHYLAVRTSRWQASALPGASVRRSMRRSREHEGSTRYGLPATSRYPTAELMPDTWVFTDALGRTSLSNAEVGDPRTDRTLALFSLDMARHLCRLRTPFNVQEFIDKQTAAGIPLRITFMTSIMPAVLSATGAQYFGISRSMATTARMMCGYSAGRRSFRRRRADVVFSDNTNATLVRSDAYPLAVRDWPAPSRTG